MNRVFGVGVILFCFEIGLFLIYVPWSTLWENNFLFIYAPGIRPFLLSTFFRSAVTALGGLNCLIGISEVLRFYASNSKNSKE
jgi:hypothetical protein